MENKSCVFIDKWLRREWVGIVPHSIIQTTVSLSGSPSASKPPLLAWLWTDLPSLLACRRQTQNYPLLACSLTHFLPFLSFPICVLQWNEATDRQMGRWGSTVFPRPKANWERLGKDLRCRIVLTWWENQCALPVYLHHAEVRDHSLMLTLLRVIKSFVSTLTSRSDSPAADWLNECGWSCGSQRGDAPMGSLHFFRWLSACTHFTYCKLSCWTTPDANHKKKEKNMSGTIIWLNHFHKMCGYMMHELTHVLCTYLEAITNLLAVFQVSFYSFKG